MFALENGVKTFNYYVMRQNYIVIVKNRFVKIRHQ